MLLLVLFNILINLNRCHEPHCAIDCVYDGCTCQPTTPGTFCYPRKGWACPPGCHHTREFIIGKGWKDRCESSDPYSICGLIKDTMTCPPGCSYHETRSKCFSPDINVVCHVKWHTFCPKGYSLNARGDVCLDANGSAFNSPYSCENKESTTLGKIMVLTILFGFPMFLTWIIFLCLSDARRHNM